MSAAVLRRLHLWLAVAWMFPGIPAAWWIVYGFEDTKGAAFAILLVSLWANTASHWGAYQATRAEEKADQAIAN